MQRLYKYICVTSVIREKLKEYKQVASVADEHADRGGAGSTIVQMK